MAIGDDWHGRSRQRDAASLAGPAGGLEEIENYRGVRYVVARAPEGWWTAIPQWDVETMFCQDRSSARKAAEAVIDGMLRAEQASTFAH